jgi:PAS domain S-box-containing protein
MGQRCEGPRAGLEAVADVMPQIVFTARPDGERDFFNARFREYTGRDSVVASTESWLETVHPDDRQAVRAAWSDAVVAGAPYEVESRLRRHDGAYRWFLSRAVRMADGGRWFGTVVDIDDQKAAQLRLRDDAAMLEVLNQFSALVAGHVDQDKVVQAVTDVATQITGAQFGALFYNVVGEHGESYLLYTLSGVEREAFAKFPMPRNTAVFGPTFRGEGIIRLDDVTKDARYGHNAPYHGMPPGHLPVRSYLAVPVVSSTGEVLAGLFLGHHRAGVFTARAEELVKGIAAHAAIAMDNARLHKSAADAIARKDESLALLDALFNAAPIGMAVVDHDLRYIRMNAHLAELDGVTMEQALGRRLSEVVPLLAERVEPLYRGVLETGVPVRDLELIDVPVGPTPAGDPERAPGPQTLISSGRRDLLVNYYPVHGKGGERLAVGGLVVDVTDRRRDEARQRFMAQASAVLGASLELDETLASLADLCVPRLADWCAVYLFDGDTARPVTVAHADNLRAEVARGFGIDRPVDLAASYGVGAVLRTGTAELYEQVPPSLWAGTARSADELRALEVVGMRSAMIVPLISRERVLGAIAFVISDSDQRYGPVDLAFAEDLARRAALSTDNAQLFQEARAAREALMRANASLEERVQKRTAELQAAVQELESFSYSVSHDLRSPIRHIAGFAEFLDKQAGPVLDERSSRYLLTIRNAARHAGQLIDDLLAFSRMGRAELAQGRIDMDGVVAACREELAAEAMGRCIDWRVQALAPARGDPSLVRLVMQNLLSNALKYTRSRREARVVVDSEVRGAEVEYRVADNGVGFDMKYAPKLFGVFQRLHTQDEFEGTGIGLANVRRIVQRHGGRVWAEGRPDAGAVFHFTLPSGAGEARPS